MRIIAHPLLRIAFLSLLMAAGLICGPASIYAQVKDSYTHTENWGESKKITTETKYENGDVTVQTKYVDAQGKPIDESSVTKKPDGETVSEHIAYDSKGRIKERSQSRSDLNGHLMYQLFEQYEDGVLHTGDSFYYDSTGNIKSHRKYNSSTQTYEAVNVQAGQSGLTEAPTKFRQNVPYGQPSQPPPMMPPYGYGMGGYGSGYRTDDSHKRDETSPIVVPPYGAGGGGYNPPRYPYPGAPGAWPAPPPPP